MTMVYRFLATALLIVSVSVTAVAAPFGKIDTPPLSERWFGIYVNSERVGFYRQLIEKSDDGYRIEGNGSVRMKVMNFAKEASMREIYQVSKNLALRSFDVDQTVNGSSSHISGKVSSNIIHIKNETNGKITDKTIKIKGSPGNHKVKLFRVVLSTKRTDYVVTNDMAQDNTQAVQEGVRLSLESRAVSP